MSPYTSSCGAQDKTWAEPRPLLALASIRSLRYDRVSDASPAANASGLSAAQSGGTVSVPIPMTSVVGLPAALSQINNSIASLTASLNGSGMSIPMTNVTGLADTLSQINNSINNLTTTVSSLTAIVQNLGSVPVFVDFEVPVGAVDGSNATFVLNAVPSPQSSLVLRKNGMVLTAGAEYSLSGNTIVFSQNAVPQSDDQLSATYRLSSSVR
jgi:hypothetical protein